MENFKAYRRQYGIGAIVGAILILILGFTIGPLTTNGSAEELASAAATARDVVYCVAHAKQLVDSGQQSAPTSGSERTDLARASFADLLADGPPRGALLRCGRALPRD